MTTQHAPEKHEFQAEVKQLLDIVIHSLYTDKEIFIRELVSNASDALEKLRHTQISEKDIFDDNLDLEINVSTDETGGTVTIQDFGIGMTREELTQNLGTIAHSGSKAFLEALKEKGQGSENLIGQFGVGFYSAFMVAEKVDVYTHSWKKDAPGLCWSSDGSGSYTIEEVEGQRRGCKIVIKLKDEFKEFAKEQRVKTVLEHYSNYVPFPLNLNGERTNKIEPIWLKSKSEVKEEDYKEFYKFQAGAFTDPFSWLHFSADAPLAINALLYIPTENTERLGIGRTPPGVSLHCRKILIDREPKGLFPEWLRFLKGVVDSEDLPLNISRETMQDSSLVQKLNRVLTKRFLKYLEEMAKKEPENYKTFWKTFGYFVKEGITTDFTHREQLGKLLRFESSATEKGELTSLDDYISRAKDDQKEIYYLVGQNREGIESGPYLEAFKARNLEVLFLYEPIDDFVMSHLGEFDGKKLVSGDSDDITFESVEPSKDQTPPLPPEEVASLCEWLKKTLEGQGVSEVSGSNRLVDSPALVVNADKMMNAQMRRIMKAMNEEHVPEVKVNLQINPSHALIKNLSTLKEKNPELAQLAAQQILDNTMVAAGLLEDPREMLERNFKILEAVTKIE